MSTYSSHLFCLKKFPLTAISEKPKFFRTAITRLLLQLSKKSIIVYWSPLEEEAISPISFEKTSKWQTGAFLVECLEEAFAVFVPSKLVAFQYFFTHALLLWDLKCSDTFLQSSKPWPWGFFL